MMTHMIRTISALCVLSGSWASPAIPAAVADKFGAKCLDGSPPTYDVSLNKTSSQWVLFLEGGGWCYGATVAAATADCAARGGAQWPPKSGDYDSSVVTAQVGSGSADIGGIMSSNPAINPDFYTWNKVFMHYCDGSSFGGGRADPIAVTRGGKPGDLWLRGRNNFDALVSYFSTTLGMDSATDIILSGGSAGGLAVFYNLDHFATLLPPSVRLVGFPDAGFFMDVKGETSGKYDYRANFQGADPVWNVTGSGGTNLKCLAANAGEKWKCLMAQYIAPHVETPMFVMNSDYDAWQMEHVLGAQCIPTPTSACTGDQNASLRSFRDQFAAAITAGVIDGKPKNGVFLDSCYVHEQNVDYCSNQGMPNCVGWSPLSPGSKKWGYTTAVSGRTPQQAFGAWWKGETVVAIDDHKFWDNPTCVYLGHTPQPIPGAACKPSGGCCDFSGIWYNNPDITHAIKYNFTLPYGPGTCNVSFGGAGSGVEACHGGSVDNAYAVASGDTLTACPAFYDGLRGSLAMATPEDEIKWANGAGWFRVHGNHT
jgi:hypothetical protein